MACFSVRDDAVTFYIIIVCPVWDLSNIPITINYQVNILIRMKGDNHVPIGRIFFDTFKYVAVKFYDNLIKYYDNLVKFTKNLV